MKRQTHRFLHVQIHTVLACIHTYMHTYIHPYIQTYILTYLHTYMLTYLHTYVRNVTYVHTYIHSFLFLYISIGTCTCPWDSTLTMYSLTFYWAIWWVLNKGNQLLGYFSKSTHNFPSRCSESNMFSSDKFDLCQWFVWKMCMIWLAILNVGNTSYL